MRIEERNDVFKIEKSIDIYPYRPDQATLDPDTGETMDASWAEIANMLARRLNTERLRGAIAYVLQEQNMPSYLAYRCHPVLDIVYTEPCIVTELTNIKRDKKEDVKNGYTYEMVHPSFYFNIYDMFGGLPFLSYDISEVVYMCREAYKNGDSECAAEFMSYWMLNITDYFGGPENFAKAICKPDFSKQPLEDLYVVFSGNFLDDEIPINAYDGDAELASYKAPSDLEALHKRFWDIKKIRREEWDRYSSLAKERDDKRYNEFRDAVKKYRG